MTNATNLQQQPQFYSVTNWHIPIQHAIGQKKTKIKGRTSKKSSTCPSPRKNRKQHPSLGFSKRPTPQPISGLLKWSYVAPLLQFQQNLYSQQRHVIRLHPSVFSILVLHVGQNEMLAGNLSRIASSQVPLCHSSLHQKQMLVLHIGQSIFFSFMSRPLILPLQFGFVHHLMRLSLSSIFLSLNLCNFSRISGSLRNNFSSSWSETLSPHSCSMQIIFSTPALLICILNYSWQHSMQNR